MQYYFGDTTNKLVGKLWSTLCSARLYVIFVYSPDIYIHFSADFTLFLMSELYVGCMLEVLGR